jgi:huntingtin interacting protein 1
MIMKNYITDIAEVCKLVGSSAFILLASIKSKNEPDDVANNVVTVKSRVAEVAELIEKLTNAVKGDSAEVIGDLVESELASIDKAIEEAANRIEVSVKSVVHFVFLEVSEYSPLYYNYV